MSRLILPIVVLTSLKHSSSCFHKLLCRWSNDVGWRIAFLDRWRLSYHSYFGRYGFQTRCKLLTLYRCISDLGANLFESR
ncbi:hypothetical protein GGR57DRAFT_466821 [Xylariaceae sp. FL1272]|nr:hypothetical protein GGR57DRAFT_466821 [Xylariaceae sp. FL1272]